MKTTKIILIICIAALVVGLGYVCLRPTEIPKEKQKPCPTCDLMRSQEQVRLVGTVTISAKDSLIFNHRITDMQYHLIPCDAQCESKELNDLVRKYAYDNGKQLYLDLEGEHDEKLKAFVYCSATVLGERIFLNPKAAKGLTFDEIKEKHSPLEQEDFLLNESHYAGLRAFLPHYYSKEQLKQAIQLKEATWETSDSTVITIWFERKPNQQNKLIPIEYYEWDKGSEF